jgi:hypothetical protein
MWESQCTLNVLGLLGVVVGVGGVGVVVGVCVGVGAINNDYKCTVEYFDYAVYTIKNATFLHVVIMCYTLCQCCSNCNVVDGNGIMS